MDRRPRLHELDNLRAFVIVLVVVLHAAITYMTPAPTWWYVIDPDQSVAFSLLVLLVDVPLMPIMFFVAGYLATPSIRRRGPRGFVREKAIRLGIPWVLGVVFLAPLATYMTYVSRGIPTGYLQFWTNDFWGPMFQQSVYWFLGVLFLEFLVLAYAYVFPARALLQAEARVSPPPGVAFFLLFIGLTAGGSAVFSGRLGLDDWQSMGWLFVIQPARVAFYVGYFMLGVHAERKGWLTDGGYRPNPAGWGLACVAAAVVYVAFRASVPLAGMAERSAGSLLFGVFCLAALMAGLAIFGRWGNGAGRAWRTLAANSFGVYYIHPLILYPLAWMLVGVGVPAVAKFTMLVAVTVVASLAVSVFVLRRAPGLRRMF
jgi:glucans biosynthesis protein C